MKEDKRYISGKSIGMSATPSNFVYSIFSGENSNSTIGYMVKPAEQVKVKKIEFHNKKITVVYWSDGDVTRVICGKGDTFSAEHGLAMAVAKKFYGSYEHFSWSLDKAKHYENGVKVKKG